MIGVAVYWERFVGVKCPTYLPDIWKDTVKPMGATHLLYIDEQGLEPKYNDSEIQYSTHPSLEDIFEIYPDATYVFFEAERNIPPKMDFTFLKDFDHPDEDVIYVIGKDSAKLPLKDLPLEDNYVVSIDTYKGYAMWSIVVAGILLYDRKVK